MNMCGSIFVYIDTQRLLSPDTVMASFAGYPMQPHHLNMSRIHIHYSTGYNLCSRLIHAEFTRLALSVWASSHSNSSVVSCTPLVARTRIFVWPVVCARSLSEGAQKVCLSIPIQSFTSNLLCFIRDHCFQSRRNTDISCPASGGNQTFPHT
ncbi:hypothetical protein M405DRAFT_48679 [Rhizopogon salebrosus TDB-379]|nr:hypothetical protein M405DRAFT_48679 [Rhizopogon salebrosus TDB-379]